MIGIKSLKVKNWDLRWFLGIKKVKRLSNVIFLHLREMAVLSGLTG